MSTSKKVWVVNLLVKSPKPSTELWITQTHGVPYLQGRNVEREGFKLGFLPELKSQPLHAAEQSSLPVPYIRQRRSYGIPVPRKFRPVRAFVDIAAHSTHSMRRL